MFKKTKRNVAVLLSLSMLISSISPTMADKVNTKELSLSSYIYQFGFEENPFENGWTQVDADNDGYTWVWDAYRPHSGSHAMYSVSYNEFALDPDNYLISPKISCTQNAVLEFYASNYSSEYLDSIAVYVGSSNEPENMVMISDGFITPDTKYTKYQFSLEEYVDEDIYIAIRHAESYDEYRVSIDDFAIVDNDAFEHNNALIEEEKKDVIYEDILKEDFENNPFENGWTQVDADNDGYGWVYRYNNGEGDFKTHSGAGIVYSESYYNANFEALFPDNYLISPQIHIPKYGVYSEEAYVEFYAAGQDNTWYFDEVFSVYVGTSSDPGEMEMISDGDITTNSNYVKYRFYLDDYLGEDIYIAIRHTNVTDRFILNIDDFKVAYEIRNIGNFCIDLSEESFIVDSNNYSFARIENIVTLLNLYGIANSDNITNDDGISYVDVNEDGNIDFYFYLSEENNSITFEKASSCSIFGSTEFIVDDNEDIKVIKELDEDIPYYEGFEIYFGELESLTAANTTVNLVSNNTLYSTGKELKPAVEVKYNGITLTENTDYVLEYSDNINPGTGTIVVKGIGGYIGEISKTFTINKFNVATVDDITIVSYDDNDNKIELTDGKIVPGLTWDKENATLTLSNYNGGPLYVECINDNGDLVDINIIIEGENTISVTNAEFWNDTPIFYINGINATISGNGRLTINSVESNDNGYSDYSLDCYGNLTIDGPTLISNNLTDAIYISTAYRYFLSEEGTIIDDNEGGKLIINSGDIILNNVSWGHDSESYATYAIYGEDIEINGGYIYIGNHDVYPELNQHDESFSNNGLFYSNTLEADNANIVIVNDEFFKDFNIIYSYDGLNPVIGDNLTITVLDIKDATVDIFNSYLSQYEYDYDGTDKKPEVTVDGLIEGIHYEVIYDDDTISVGTKSVTIKGIGDFSGEVELSYTIKSEKSEDGTEEGVNNNDNTAEGNVENTDSSENIVADGPSEGTTVKDKKYIYKVTKAGSKDGSIIGELEVTGLKKKSLKTIKIAKTVTIDGVKYKVTSVGKKAFKGNKKITKVFIGKNVKSIGANAFAGCKKLKQASINSTVLKSIGKNAFKGDKKLNKIIIKSKKLKKIAKGAFKGTSKKLVVKVPKAKKKAYKKLVKKAGNKKAKVK